jgi:hypothetical protein
MKKLFGIRESPESIYTPLCKSTETGEHFFSFFENTVGLSKDHKLFGKVTNKVRQKLSEPTLLSIVWHVL